MKDFQTVFYNILHREWIIHLTLGCKKFIIDSLSSHQTWTNCAFQEFSILRERKNTLHFFSGFIAESLGQSKSLAKLSELHSDPWITHIDSNNFSFNFLTLTLISPLACTSVCRSRLNTGVNLLQRCCAKDTWGKLSLSLSLFLFVCDCC